MAGRDEDIAMAMYQEPGRVVSLANSAIGFVVGKLGWSVQGAHLLEVRGRTSGRTQTVPVNPLAVGGNRFLVAPRGETQWVRNFRVAGEGVLRVGKESERIVGREVEDADKPEVLRAYLDHWYGQVKGQFDVPKDASLEQLARIAGNYPVFQIHSKESTRKRY